MNWMQPMAGGLAGRISSLALSLALSVGATAAHAALGMTELAPRGDDGPVTVYYPTDAAEQLRSFGRTRLSVASDAAPSAGRHALVIVSHGSGGAPWVHADLARALVDAGFIVAMPQHHRDNVRDPSNPGPDSWTLRPGEVSRAIDTLAADARFGALVSTARVGVYGMSAGGHTALSMAGGRWSPAGFKRHCDAHLAEDFQFCVGLITQLDGGWLDGIKQWAARAVIAARFSDDTPRDHRDDRIAAVVAAVPAAADFDMVSLAHPRVPLGFVTALHDEWLHHRFHAGRVLQACSGCELIAELPDGGHGAYLSPLPPGFTGLEGRLLNDPPGFDRAVLPAIDRKIAAFFVRHLGAPKAAGDSPA